MKITNSQLKNIIQEELESILNEYNWVKGDKVIHDKFGTGTVDVAKIGRQYVHVIWDNPQRGKPNSCTCHRGSLKSVTK
tara:strand:- start:1234 stop:1470 length:237 start_codon:yes stop_codon:yes gene_type:complete